jgi:hypothetical protein
MVVSFTGTLHERNAPRFSRSMSAVGSRISQTATACPAVTGNSATPTVPPRMNVVGDAAEKGPTPFTSVVMRRAVAPEVKSVSGDVLTNRRAFWGMLLKRATIRVPLSPMPAADRPFRAGKVWL